MEIIDKMHTLSQLSQQLSASICGRTPSSSLASSSLSPKATAMSFVLLRCCLNHLWALPNYLPRPPDLRQRDIGAAIRPRGWDMAICSDSNTSPLLLFSSISAPFDLKAYRKIPMNSILRKSAGLRS
ncbi:hypothetical protein MRB53_023327 [Persea americana]|uniref:Uncharacterized protein n=1 Tax=Persea americana TaxID=3435 RepID=A0ACC2L971_PERAE|nr:hypothetical protein MRB53_023327 [Persea americana]